MKNDLDPGVRSHGMANMQNEAWIEAQKYAEGRGHDLDAYESSWDTPVVAMTGAAWLLSKRENDLPGRFNRNYSKEELARIGYNFTEEWMLKIAALDRPAKGDPAQVISDFDTDWKEANSLLCGGVYFTC